MAASREELAAVPKLPGRVAREIYDHLHKTDSPGGDAADPVEAAAWN